VFTVELVYFALKLNDYFLYGFKLDAHPISE